MRKVANVFEARGLPMQEPNLPDNCVRFFYNGRSMRPTFRNGDALAVRSIDFTSVECGDVVVFRSEPGKRAIVHRAAAKCAGFIITRGDACLYPDEGSVGPDRFVGRVEWVARNGRTRRVRGGGSGRLLALRARTRIVALAALKALLRRPYRLLSGCRRMRKLARSIWRPVMSAVCFYESGEAVFKIVSGDRQVAEWDADKARLKVTKPFDLLIGPEGEDASAPQRMQALREVLSDARAELTAAGSRGAQAQGLQHPENQP